MGSTVSSAAQDSVAPAASIGTRPLSDALGAEILGLDLSAPFSDAVFAEIERKWHSNLVVLFRDQQLTEDDQVRFARCFGPLSVSHTRRFNTDNPAVMLISNIRENGKPIGALPDGEMHFHTDQCHQEKPAMASMLYALEVPREGGNTLFANCYRAYETLPDEIKARIAAAKAVNVYDYDAASTTRGSKIREGIPYYSHPVVRTHPATGRKSLYVNRLMTAFIEGMDEDESADLLEFLFDHQEKPEFVYEHVWRVNDLLLWDNRCALHARTDFSPEERRLMRRVVIAGEKPF
jgi:taurine dioxygenase